MNEQFVIPSQVGPVGATSVRVPARYSNQRQNWAAIAQLSRALTGVRGGNQLTADLLTAAKRGGHTLLRHPHPFKIYNVPSVCLASNDQSTDWLRFRVRSGLIGNLDVNGTDEVTDPYNDEVPTDGTGDIVLISGLEQIFFWIELSKPSGINTATIKHSDDPNSNGWADYPDTDGRFILLGWVDTSDTTNKQSKVRQIQVTDIQMGVTVAVCSGGSSSESDFQAYRFDAPP